MSDEEVGVPEHGVLRPGTPENRRRILTRLVGTRRKVEAPLDDETATRWMAGNKGKANSRGIFLPYDFPVHVRAYRLIQPTEDHKPPLRHAEAMVGWTLEVDLFSFGVKVYVRVGLLDGTLKIITEDYEDGRVVVAEWSKD